jgi:2-desacetyl-2-hydroxyethyl bacteriochlorophyllide A dehydrogenase
VDRGAAGAEGNDGAFARFVRVDHRTVVEIPGGLDLRVAALAEPLAVSLHAVTRSNARPGDRVLVIGAGPIGALAVIALRARGITDLVVSEPRRTRRALARALGAEVIEPDALETISIAEPHRVVAEPFDAVVECSGKREAMEAALCQLRRGGTLVLVGTGMEPPTFDPNRILLNELVVTGAFEYDTGGFDEALHILASGELDVATLLAPDDVPLSGLLAAMEDLAAGNIAGKVLTAPGLSGDDRRESR